MGEEFEAAGVCRGNWWNSSRSIGSSPCNSSINMNDHIGSFGWMAAGELVDMKGGTRSSEDSSDDGGGATTMESTLQMMGIGLSASSTTTDWNDQPLLGQSESNYNPILQEDLNYHQETGVSDFSPSTENSVMQENQGFNSIKQLPVSSGQCRSTCQGLATFPISTTSYVYPTALLQTLFDNNSLPEQSAYDDGSMNYSSSENNYRTNLSEFFPSLPKFSSTVKPKQHVSGQLHLSNNTPFWNANSASALNDIRASYFSSAQSQFLSSTFAKKPKCPNLTPKSNQEEIRNSGSVVKKICNEPAFKRPRLETSSPLPTFKVRKEKLGDRITALQQLVSPFGKTDTASVLHEAIEYIKLLHDQVNVLSTPYMKNGASVQCQQITEKVKETEGAEQDLRSRGLCLVPVSSTFPVAAETTADFWTPNFGGTFR